MDIKEERGNLETWESMDLAITVVSQVRFSFVCLFVFQLCFNFPKLMKRLFKTNYMFFDPLLLINLTFNR